MTYWIVPLMLRIIPTLRAILNLIQIVTLMHVFALLSINLIFKKVWIKSMGNKRMKCMGWPTKLWHDLSLRKEGFFFFFLIDGKRIFPDKKKYLKKKKISSQGPWPYHELNVNRVIIHCISWAQSSIERKRFF